MRGQTGHITRPHARFSPSFLGMNAWITSQLNVALFFKLRGLLACLPYYFDMLSVGVCTTRHCQTSGRLVQELNVCTVASHLVHHQMSPCCEQSLLGILGKCVDEGSLYEL